MYHVYRFNAWIYVGIHGHYHLEGDAHKEKKYNSSVILRDGGCPVGPYRSYGNEGSTKS